MTMLTDLEVNYKSITRKIDFSPDFIYFVGHGYSRQDVFSYSTIYNDLRKYSKETFSFVHEIYHHLFDVYGNDNSLFDEAKITNYLKEIQKLDVISKIDPYYEGIINKLNCKYSLINPVLRLLNHFAAHELSAYEFKFRRLIAFLKKKAIEAIRLQYIAQRIRNRVSSSPSPQKKEPPIGGVKIGGEQPDYSRHAAGILYHKHLLKLSTAP